MYGPSGLFNYDDMWNRDDILAAEMPSSNGVATARSLARLYAALVGEIDGIRVLRPETVTRAAAVASQGADRVLLLPTCFGLGFMRPPMLAPGCGAAQLRPHRRRRLARLRRSRGRHQLRLRHHRLQFDLTGDERTRGLVRAVYESL